MKVIINHPKSETLPVDALVHEGDETVCWLYESGKAVRTEPTPASTTASGSRSPIAGPRLPRSAERYYPVATDRGHGTGIIGDLSGLTDGAAVEARPVTVEMKSASGVSTPNRGGQR